MSIVGTRPPLISETNLYEPRHKVKIFIILIEYVNSKLDRLGFGTLTRSVNFQKKFHLKQNKRIKN